MSFFPFLCHPYPPQYSFCTPLPNSLHPYAPNVQTTSICLYSLPPLHFQFPTAQSTRHSLFYQTRSHHTSSLPSPSLYALISCYPPLSWAMFHFHTPVHSVHMPCIFSL